VVVVPILLDIIFYLVLQPAMRWAAKPRRFLGIHFPF
jgi:hypothetical protein